MADKHPDDLDKREHVLIAMMIGGALRYMLDAMDEQCGVFDQVECRFV